jgi:hypothetical protein
MERIATCACRHLRLTVRGEPDRVLACHCRECQRRTGSVFGVSAYFPEDRIIASEGESCTYSRIAGGVRFETRFCPSCGTSLFWRSSALPRHVAVAVGCFADPGFPPPSIVAWTSEQHGWVRFPQGCRTTARSAFEDA